MYFKKIFQVKKRTKKKKLTYHRIASIVLADLKLDSFCFVVGGKCVKRLSEQAEYVSQSRAIGGRMGGPFSTSF